MRLQTFFLRTCTELKKGGEKERRMKLGNVKFQEEQKMHYYQRRCIKGGLDATMSNVLMKLRAMFVNKLVDWITRKTVKKERSRYMEKIKFKKI